MTHIILAVDFNFSRGLISSYIRNEIKGDYQLSLELTQVNDIPLDFIKKHKNQAIIILTDTLTLSSETNALKRIKEIKALNEKVRFLLVSSAKQDVDLPLYIDKGIKGCFTCRTHTHELQNYLDKLAKGEHAINPDLSLDFIKFKQENTLTHSQTQLTFLFYFSNGVSMEDIEDKMHLSRRSLQRIKKSILEQLNQNSDHALISYAFKKGFNLLKNL